VSRTLDGVLGASNCFGEIPGDFAGDFCCCITLADDLVGLAGDFLPATGLGGGGGGGNGFGVWISCSGCG